MDAVQGKRKNKLMKWIKIIVVLYVLVGAILYFLQDKILLHPVALPADYHFQFNVPFQEIFVPYNGSISFDVIRFESQNGSVKKGAVIYFHGNMENINRYAKFANNFAEFGYDVWMMDYPSFENQKESLMKQLFMKKHYKFTKWYEPRVMLLTALLFTENLWERVSQRNWQV